MLKKLFFGQWCHHFFGTILHQMSSVEWSNLHAKNNKAQLSTDRRPRKMSLKEQACSVIIDLAPSKSFFDNFYTKDVVQQVKLEIDQGMATAKQNLTQFYYAGDLLRQATDLALLELKRLDEHFYT